MLTVFFYAQTKTDYLEMRSFVTGAADPVRLRTGVCRDPGELRDALLENRPDLLVLRAPDVPVDALQEPVWREVLRYPHILFLYDTSFYSLRRRKVREMDGYLRDQVSAGDAGTIREEPVYEAEDVLTRALRIIRERSGDTCFGLQEATEALFVSRSYLCDLFRREMGESFGECLRRTRVRNAAAEIAHTTIQIREAAERCGILNLSYFTRLFKKYYGKTPTDYRREWQPESGGKVIPTEDIW